MIGGTIIIVDYQKTVKMLKQQFGYEAELPRCCYAGKYSRDTGYTYNPEAEGIIYQIEYSFGKPVSVLIVNMINLIMWKINLITGRILHCYINCSHVWFEGCKFFTQLDQEMAIEELKDYLKSL